MPVSLLSVFLVLILSVVSIQAIPFSNLKRSFKRALKVYSTSSVQSELVIIAENGPIEKANREFLINGWRWHTISVIRDLKRFHTKMKEEELHLPKQSSSLKCFEFVCEFNWKSLVRIEAELFFPWLREMLPSMGRTLIDDMVIQHDRIKSLSNSLRELCENRSKSDLCDKDLYLKIEYILDDMMECSISSKRIQDEIFVPYIASHISPKDQDRFNKKVIRRLGILNSQIHLVSMSEAVKEDPIEENQFHEQIPKLAQAMIPLWRKRFYNPMTNCLQLEESMLLSLSK